MQLKQLLVAGAVGFAALCQASEEWGELPANHYLWGESGGPTEKVIKRKPMPLSSTSSCTNTASTRMCWSNGYSIATDFDEKWPTTGNTVYHHFVLTNGTCNPDGASPGRPCFLVNGQYPAPLITANWGDYIQVKVTNKMEANGTSIHWHGVRQLNTNFMDGVNGITECALAPGSTETYRFQATQFGTTWYHSHFSTQYGDGIVGPLVINGPAAANYDYDLGPAMVTDFFYESIYLANEQWGAQLQSGLPGPPGNNILINGKNKAASGTGSYTVFTVQPNKKYRIRLINTSVDNNIRVTFDGHPMTIITSDFVPIHPFTTTWILLAVGQRYDVIINTNQAPGNYWMHAQAEAACSSGNLGNGLAILRYAGAAVADPTTTSPAPPGNCIDAYNNTITPYVTNTVGSVAAFQSQAAALPVSLNRPGTQTNFQNIVTWGINMTALDIQWGTPTLSYVMNGSTTFPTYSNVVSIPNEGIWTFWIIQQIIGGGPPIPHPMHLHGHDFYILGSGSGVFNKTTDPYNLKFNNPPRRDTTLLPANGWLVLAFATDNPGAWLFHCHIAWHISEGLGLQFLEASDKIVLPGSQYQSQCTKWNSWYSTSFYKQDDSGL